MSIETKTYPFRRGRSPSRYNASPMTRRKLKAKEEEDQAELDSIEVATYNDNPKHLYGLDKIDTALAENLKYIPSAKKNSWSLANGHSMNDNEDHDIARRKRHAIQFIIYLLLVALICEVVIWLDRSFLNVSNSSCSKSSETNTDNILQMKSLQKSLMEQSTLITSLNKQINILGRNCSCKEQLNLLEKEDLEHKTSLGQLQKQVLATVNVMQSLNDRMEYIQNLTDEQRLNDNEREKKEKSSLCRGEECKLLSHNIFSSIQSSLEVYHADFLGIPDFALESAGGSILSSYYSDTCEVGAPIIKVFGMSLWKDPRSPRSIINPENLPGNCWSMKGTHGFIVIKLATSIVPTLVTLEHLDKRLDQYSKESYESAPKEFEVYAWLDAKGHKKLKLGSYTYLRERNAVQTFKLQNVSTKSVDFIELRILSNHGNKDCTCIYRFRVHGQSHLWQKYESAEEKKEEEKEEEKEERK